MQSIVALLTKSLYLDLETLRIGALSLPDRVSYICKKYVALCTLAATGEATFTFRTMSMAIRDFGELGTTQACVVDFYNDVVRPGVLAGASPVVLDIGANVGQYCNAIKLFYPSAHVTSFEPDLSAFARLRTNTQHLPHVTLVNKGVGRAHAMLPFYMHEVSGMSSFQPYEDYRYDQAQTTSLEVDALDELVDEEHIDLMKIDVEGFETEVIEGAMRTIGRSEYVLVELSLKRSPYAGSNLDLIDAIRRAAPGAKIVKFGRPLGSKATPACQDVLIKVGELPRAEAT